MNGHNDDDIKHVTEFKKGRKKSNIRNYYKEANLKLECKIEGCKKRFSTKTSIATLKNHIYHLHNENIYKDDKALDTNINQMTTHELKEIKICNAFAISFAKNSLPHTLIEDTYFRKSIDLLTSDFNITKSKLRDSIISEGERINNDTLNMLSSNGHPVTIALDSWTNIRSNKVTNILLICSGIAYYYTSIENDESRNTSEWMISKLTEKINLLVSMKIKIIAITTDNENLMKSVRRKLADIYPILIVIPCSAHIIQLCLKKICDTEKIKTIIDKTKNIIDSIESNKVNELKLLKLQEEDGIKEPLKLIMPIEIRWTSLIDSIDRLLLLKSYIKKTLKYTKNKYWDELNDLSVFISPFKIMIEQIQKDNASLYSVYTNFRKILDFYNSDTIPNVFKDYIVEIIQIFKNKWDDHMNSDLIEAIKLFNLEQNFRFNKSTISFIITWGVNYLITYDIIKDNNEIETLKDKLSYQLDEFIARQNEFVFINSNYNEIIKKMNGQKYYDIKILWHQYLPSHYELSKVVIAILSVTPSESSVERSFSIQSDVHSKERNKLSKEVIEAEMNIKINLK